MKLKNIYLIIFLLLFTGLNTNSFAQERNKEFKTTNKRYELVAYPIPAKTEVNIKMNADLIQDADEIIIINIIGREVCKQKLNNDHKYSDVKFPQMQQFQNGIYIIIAKNKFGEIIHSSKIYLEN